MFLLLWNWLFKVWHLHTEDASSQHGLLETPIFFILPTTTHPLHPGAQRSVRKGGVMMEEGRVSRAGLNHVWLLKKKKRNKGGGRRGAKRNRRAEKKYLKTASREAQKQEEWETGVPEDVVEIQEGGQETIQKLFSPLLWLKTENRITSCFLS